VNTQTRNINIEVPPLLKNSSSTGQEILSIYKVITRKLSLARNYFLSVLIGTNSVSLYYKPS